MSGADTGMEADAAAAAPVPSTEAATAALLALGDDALLEHLQRAAIDYFLHTANPANGLVADTTREGSPCSIAVVGFALSAYTIAIERGWLAHDEALARSLAVLRFFRDSEQGEAPLATGHRGFYYHFLDMHSGRRMWQSELSMIDTALLLAGALTAASYFTADTAPERELRAIVDALYRRVDWCWAQGGEATLRQGWKPESGFLNYGWDGYNEGLILYVLALGSPTHAIDPGHYAAWTATYQWENLYDIDFLYAGPLFIHQFSHAWIDFRGIRDAFMREKRCDYFENSRRATEVQREYARRNPLAFRGYAGDCWGLTACDGPSDPPAALATTRLRLFGYAARGVPYGPDDGSIGGWAPLASLPFAPELVLRAARTTPQREPARLPAPRGAGDCEPGLAAADGGAWVSVGHFGLDQGIVSLMIENQRSGLVWRLMRGCPAIRRGLQRAGFRGGWL